MPTVLTIEELPRKEWFVSVLDYTEKIKAQPERFENISRRRTGSKPLGNRWTTGEIALPLPRLLCQALVRQEELLRKIE